ncbi:MAG: hypothetical protein Q9M39_04060 [Sulfurovum sp.]|nr:hypothetical protein [Sulfurovum sp.]
MQLELEKNKLYAQLQEIKMIQNMSKQKLFILGRINHSSSTTLSCSDMYPIREKVQLKGNMFHLSKNAYKKRIESTQVALERHSKALDSISLVCPI